MTSPFRRPIRSAVEVATHREQRLVEEVVRKLEGMPEPQAPKLIDTSNKGIADNRIQEIVLTTDLGWGDPNAVRLSQHHVRNAVAMIDNHADNWGFNTMRCGPGGWNDLGEAAAKMIKSLRARTDPATYVAKAEFDPDGALERTYDQIEVSHLNRIASIKQQCDQMREATSRGSRSRIRQLEINELQSVLDSMARSTEKWEISFNQACKEVGF
jgi:hypothetical protein